MNKETILKEIQRIAAANGGVAPGRLALESETGIRESAWRGVYWAKWNDAVREAGLEPNKKVTAYPKDQVLHILAKLTKEIGHIPTYAELRLKSRTQPGIPADKVFTRLGGKSEIVTELREYCESRPEFSDVVAICEESLVALAPDSDIRTALTDADGIVYLLKSGRRYKFGFTNDIDRRISELANQTAEKIFNVHSIRTDDPSGIEAYWKRRFAAKCVHNEWFTLDAKDVAAFRRRKKFM